MRATTINEEMKLAAVRAIAELTKEPVPELVNLAYGRATSLVQPTSSLSRSIQD